MQSAKEALQNRVIPSLERLRNSLENQAFVHKIVSALENDPMLNRDQVGSLENVVMQACGSNRRDPVAVDIIVTWINSCHCTQEELKGQITRSLEQVYSDNEQECFVNAIMYATNNDVVLNKSQIEALQRAIMEAYKTKHCDYLVACTIATQLNLGTL